MTLAVAVVLLSSAPDAGQQVVFGSTRPVTLSVPRAYAGRPTPLLLVLHGYGSSGKHCATHTEVAATLICVRCGGFMCSVCGAADGSHCASCTARAATSAPSRS
mgnify:FL=1